MVGFKKRTRGKKNGHRQPANGSSVTILAADLATPDFDESWQAGSPLNWVDFVNHWDRQRALRKAIRDATDGS
jgi:hypothetical protein